MSTQFHTVDSVLRENLLWKLESNYSATTELLSFLKMYIQFGLGLREKLSPYQGKDPLVQKYPGLEEMEKN